MSGAERFRVTILLNSNGQIRSSAVMLTYPEWEQFRMRLVKSGNEGFIVVGDQLILPVSQIAEVRRERKT
jgi:hypothetical protein